MSHLRPRTSLPVLDEQVEARAAAIRAEHTYWPCKRGCDLCCRSLPHLPTITEVEWLRVAEAIEALEPELQLDVRRRTRAAVGAEPPVTCPLLDPAAGVCLVYRARPVACRTYGYFAERDAGLHCEQVSRAVAQHGDEERVVWGNGEAIATALRAEGEPRSLAVWMREAT